jgi:uncharacterized membrane protein (DUF485 family)
VSGPTESDSTPSAGRPTPDDDVRAQNAAEYTALDASPEFQDLRSTYRRFVIPVTTGALAFYFAYVLLSVYAPGFMGEKLFGNINVGLVFGLLQFVMVFAITTIYVRFARNTLDPKAEKIRAAHARLDAEAGR